jgi:hypothetical protein
MKSRKVRTRRYLVGTWLERDVNHFAKMMSKREVGRFFTILANRGFFTSKEMSYIFDQEVEFVNLAPEGCLKVWDL